MSEANRIMYQVLVPREMPQMLRVLAAIRHARTGERQRLGDVLASVLEAALRHERALLPSLVNDA